MAIEIFGLYLELYDWHEFIAAAHYQDSAVLQLPDFENSFQW